MAFSDHLAQPAITGFFVLRISGLPYLFSDQAPPSSWLDTGETNKVTYEGEQYTWIQCLDIPDDFGKIAQKIQPKAGLGTSGELSFNLFTVGPALDPSLDPLLDILNNNVNRTDKNAVTLEEDVPYDAASPASTTLTMSTNPWLADDVDLYFGEETLGTVGGVSFNNTKTAKLERGKYGSRRRYHRAEIISKNQRQPTAMIVSDWPLTFQGRFAELWLCMTVPTTRPPEPYGDSLSSDDNKKIFGGIVERLKEGDDLLTVTFECSSLDRAIQGDACRQFPTFKAGLGEQYFDTATGAPTHIYIGPHNWWVHFFIDGPGLVEAPVIVPTATGDISDGDTITIGGLTLTFADRSSSTASQIAHNGNPYETEIIRDRITDALNLNGAPYDQWRLKNGVGISLQNFQLNDTQFSSWTVETDSPGITIYPDSWQDNEQLVGFDSRLRRVGGAGYEDVPEGVYEVGFLANYLQDTIEERLEADVNVFGGISFTQGRNGKSKTSIRLTARPNEITKDWTFTLLDRYRNRDSFLRDLGFNSDSGTVGKADTEGTWLFESERAPAKFRWPARTQVMPAKLFIHDADSSWHTDNVDSDLGWVDDDGWKIKPHLLLDKVDVIKITQDSYTATDDFTFFDSDTGYVTVEQRALFGADDAGERYIECDIPDKQKHVNVYRVPAFPNCSSVRILLYSLLSGSGEVGSNHPTYDAGWEDAGLYLPSRFVDVNSFLRAHNEYPHKRDNWIIRPGFKAREIFEEESKLTQLQIVPGNGQLYMTNMDAVLETEESTAFELDQQRMVTNDSRGVGFSRDEGRLVNKIEADIDYDHSTGKSRINVTTNEVGSISTWGEKQPMRLRVYGLRGSGDANFSIKTLGNIIFATYGRPYVVIEMDSATPETWDLQIGDIVLVSHPGLPSISTNGRGVVDLPCRLAVKEDYYGGAGDNFSRLTLTTRAYNGRRFSQWGPSCRLTQRSDGSATVWETDKSVYGIDQDIADLSFFAAGQMVNVAREDGFSLKTKTTTTIDAISSLTGETPIVTFSDSIAWTQASVMWFADYDQEEIFASQQKYLYWSGGTNQLDNNRAATTDKAFTYL